MIGDIFPKNCWTIVEQNSGTIVEQSVNDVEQKKETSNFGINKPISNSGTIGTIVEQSWNNHEKEK